MTAGCDAAAAASAWSAQCRSSSTTTSGARSETPRRKPLIASKSRNCPSSESVRGLRQVREEVAQRGKMRCSSTAYGPHSLRRTSSAFWAAIGAADLHPRPVRRRTGRLVRAAPEHLRAAHAGVGLQFLRGARLADAGLAHQHHDRAVPGEGVVEGACAAAPVPARARRRRRAPGGRARSRSRSGWRSSGRGVHALERGEHLGGGRRAVGGHLREQAQDERLRAPAGSAPSARRARPAAC